MPTINIKVRNKVASATATAVANNSDYTLAFDFDEEWDAYTSKTCRICYESNYTDVVFNGASCAMPQVDYVGCVQIGVYAGDLHTTTPAMIMLRRSVLTNGGTPVDPPESVYNQIISMLSNTAATVTKDGNTSVISITDKNGVTTTATVIDGTEGQPGQDGYSPTATVEKTGTVSTLTVTDRSGTTVTEINDGPKGEPGSDAEVTTENIKNALGYTPADASAVAGNTAAIGQLNEDIVNKQDKLTAGENITIVDNVISATGGGSSTDEYTRVAYTYYDGEDNAQLGVVLPKTICSYKKLHMMIVFRPSGGNNLLCMCPGETYTGWANAICKASGYNTSYWTLYDMYLTPFTEDGRDCLRIQYTWFNNKNFSSTNSNADIYGIMDADDLVIKDYDRLGNNTHYATTCSYDGLNTFRGFWFETAVLGGYPSAMRVEAIE